MPILSWPSSLPAPQRSDYGLEPVERVGRTTMESGRRRARLMGQGTPTVVQVSWLFSQDQMALFEAWHQLEAAGGALPFSVALLNGMGVQTVTASFIGMFKAKPVGVRFQVTASLQIEQRPLLSREQLDFVTAHGITDINTAGAGLHRLIHHTLPTEGW